jgi:hypothetical protein
MTDRPHRRHSRLSPGLFLTITIASARPTTGPCRRPKLTHCHTTPYLICVASPSATTTRSHSRNHNRNCNRNRNHNRIRIRIRIQAPSPH